MSRDATEPDATSPDDALTTRDVSTILGLAEITIQQQRQRGAGPPFFRVGRSIRYVRRDVLAYRNARKIGGAK